MSATTSNLYKQLAAALGEIIKARDGEIERLTEEIETLRFWNERKDQEIAFLNGRLKEARGGQIGWDDIFKPYGEPDEAILKAKDAR